MKRVLSFDLLGCWGSTTFSLPFIKSELVLPLLNLTFSSNLDVFHFNEDVEIDFKAFNAIIPAQKLPFFIVSLPSLQVLSYP